ncbi:hypothetical protein WJX74_002287 [Apatococcus lobatus]|uniref:Uncharacterized protein n=2 Tax=Apatococcus TaxID=904362 RepID=A0AAW1T6X6_9CHLO
MAQAFPSGENSEQQVGRNPTIEQEPLQPPFPKKDVQADAKHLEEQRNLGSFGDQLKAFNAIGNDERDAAILKGAPDKSSAG